MNLVLSLLIGGGLGATLGYFGKCTSGTCPLTANPWRGAAYGAVLGLLFHLSGFGSRGSLAAESSPNVKLVDQTQFESAVQQASGPVVVDFFATWCGPCKRLAPMLDELAAPLTNRITFLKVDVDKSPALAQRFRVEAIPVVVFLRNGKEAERLLGLPGREELKKRLESLAAQGTATVERTGG